MQDRFKFRAKRLDNNKFYYGSYLYLHNAPEYNWNGTKNGKYKDVHYIIDETDVNIGIDPQTLCQCTGKKDKNGKLVYENDIITDGYDNYLVVFDEVYLQYMLEQDNTRFVFEEFLSIEIIGNIFENKDLLKEN